MPCSDKNGIGAEHAGWLSKCANAKSIAVADATPARQQIAQQRGLKTYSTIPDLLRDESIDAVLSARPEIFNHNLETVRRLTPSVRSRATYDRSLSVLRKVKAKAGDAVFTKSGLMLGLGETAGEVLAVMRDLRAHDVDILTLGQYLRPSPKHLPIVRYVTPGEFDEFRFAIADRVTPENGGLRSAGRWQASRSCATANRGSQLVESVVLLSGYGRVVRQITTAGSSRRHPEPAGAVATSPSMQT